MSQYHHRTDVSDEEMMKLNFRYFVKDFTEEQVTIFNIVVYSVLMLISGPTLGAFDYVDIIIC